MLISTKIQQNDKQTIDKMLLTKYSRQNHVKCMKNHIKRVENFIASNYAKQTYSSLKRVSMIFEIN